MKAPALAALFFLTGLVGAALVCFLGADAGAAAAGEELAQFRQRAEARAAQARIFRLPDGSTVVSMVRPGLAPADQARMEVLELKHQSLLYRRGLAEWGFTRGTLLAVGLLGLAWLRGVRPPADVRAASL